MNKEQITMNALTETKPVLCDVLSFLDRIKKEPFSYSWTHTETGFNHIFEEVEINYEGLKDAEKLACFLYAYYLKDLCVFKRHVMKHFSWTSYKVKKLIKEINENKCKYYVEYVPTFDEDTGLLSGRGYLLNIT